MYWLHRLGWVPPLHVVAHGSSHVLGGHVLAVERHEIASRVCACMQEQQSVAATVRRVAVSYVTRTEEVGDDAVVHQVVLGLARRVVVHSERAGGDGARLWRACEANKAGVELCSRGGGSVIGPMLQRCHVSRAHTFDILLHLLHVVPCRVDANEHRLHLLPRLLLCSRRWVHACESQRTMPPQ